MGKRKSKRLMENISREYLIPPIWYMDYQNGEIDPMIDEMEDMEDYSYE